jgi:hypothetical protein
MPPEIITMQNGYHSQKNISEVSIIRQPLYRKKLWNSKAESDTRKIRLHLHLSENSLICLVQAQRQQTFHRRKCVLVQITKDSNLRSGWEKCECCPLHSWSAFLFILQNPVFQLPCTCTEIYAPPKKKARRWFINSRVCE